MIDSPLPSSVDVALYDKADSWIEAQGPGFILCTDSDASLRGVAEHVHTETGCGLGVALACAHDWRQAALDMAPEALTHSRNVWVAIALTAVRNHLGWSRNDVVRFCLSDIVAKSMGERVCLDAPVIIAFQR